MGLYKTIIIIAVVLLILYLIFARRESPFRNIEDATPVLSQRTIEEGEGFKIASFF